MKYKLNKKYFNLVFATIMALFMSFIMSGIITYVNIGIVDTFINQWIFNAFPSAFVVNLPIAIFVVPVVRNLALKIVED